MRVMFLVTEDKFFFYQLNIARAVASAGATVVVMARDLGSKSRIPDEGFGFVPWPVARGFGNPIQEVSAFLRVFAEYRRQRPTICHHVALKPIVYGGLAATMLGLPSLNWAAGLGHLFTESKIRTAPARKLVLVAIRIILKGRALLTVENEGDRDVLDQSRVDPSKICVVPGAGVDMHEFPATAEAGGVPIVMLASRMLWKKGIAEFVQAATLLRDRGVQARFALVGDVDAGNPGSLTQETMERWASSGAVEWWGWRSDMPEVLAKSTLVCLPTSYGEGVPRILIEGAAAGRPLIATDIPGCRDIVIHGENGFLVPRRSATALADSIHKLLQSPELRRKFGKRGRVLALQKFSQGEVVSRTFTLYRRLIGWPEALSAGGCGKTMSPRARANP